MALGSLWAALLVFGVGPIQSQEPLVGLRVGDDSGGCRITRSFVADIREGSLITGLRRTTERVYIPVSHPVDVTDIAVRFGDDELCFRGLTPDGETMEAVVRTNLTWLFGRRYPAVEPNAASRAPKLCGLLVDQALARKWSGFMDFCYDTAASSQANVSDRLDDFRKAQVQRWKAMSLRLASEDVVLLGTYRIRARRVLDAVSELMSVTGNAGSGSGIMDLCAQSELEDGIRDATEYVLAGRPGSGIPSSGEMTDAAALERRLDRKIAAVPSETSRYFPRLPKAPVQSACRRLRVRLDSVRTMKFGEPELRRHLRCWLVRAVQVEAFADR